MAGDRAAHDAFLRDAHIAHVLEAARSADIAFVGVGAPKKDSLLIREGSIVKWRELEELQERGAAGDINLRFFDAAGKMLPSDLDDRVVGLSLEDFRTIPHVVGVAGGAGKLGAIRGALRGKLLDVLITDHVSAQTLLEDGTGPDLPKTERKRQKPGKKTL